MGIKVKWLVQNDTLGREKEKMTLGQKVYYNKSIFLL